MSQRFTPPATLPRNKGPETITNIEVESEEQGNALRHHQLFEETDFRPSSASYSVPVEHVKSVGSDEQGNALSHHQLVEETDLEPSSALQPVPVNNVNVADCSSGLHLNATLEFMLPNTCHFNDSAVKFLEINESKELNMFSDAEENFADGIIDKIGQDTVCAYVENEFYILSGMCQEMVPEQISSNRVTASSNSNGSGTANYLDEELKDYDDPTTDDYDDNRCDHHGLEKCESTLIGLGSSAAEVICRVQGHSPSAKECSLKSEFDSGPSIAIGKNLESGCSFFKRDYSVSESTDFEDKVSESNMVNQSNQVCTIDLLEEIIDKAKTNKKTLLSSMESLINLMREVELSEKASEQAQMEAAEGGSDIMARVEELKKMVVHAKEVNNMHEGEVYGEKAILTTELRELQFRLLSLSDEKDKSVATLDEMRQALEVRLAAAEELRKASEQEKLEKEESARKALAEQEAIMEKVVQESRKLQQEAEENSKLQEFLMDRGHVVDMLQFSKIVSKERVRLMEEQHAEQSPEDMRQEIVELKGKLAQLLEALAVEKKKNQARESSIPLVGQNVASPQEQPSVKPQGKQVQTEPQVYFQKPPKEDKFKERLAAFEARLRAIEGTQGYGILDPLELCLVPDVVIPYKFKVPDFDKYEGRTCPKAHLIMYCRKMTPYAHDDKLMVHIFLDSLTGAAAHWYIGLERGTIRSWNDLANAFMKQYNYNLDMAPDWLQLSNMEKEACESFKEYVHRWRDMATQVRPPLSDREMVNTFINTLQAPFYDIMIRYAGTDFSDLVIIGERIESGIQSGRLANPARESSSRGAPLGKRKEKTHATKHEGGARGRNQPRKPYTVMY